MGTMSNASVFTIMPRPHKDFGISHQQDGEHRQKTRVFNRPTIYLKSNNGCARTMAKFGKRPSCGNEKMIITRVQVRGVTFRKNFAWSIDLKCFQNLLLF